MKETSALKSTLLLTAVGLFAQGVRFVFQVLLSRTVGAEVMGLYHLVMPVMPVLMSLTAIGFTAACSNLSARYQAVGNAKAAAQTVAACVLGFLCSFAVTALALGLLSDGVSVYLLGDARSQLGLLLLLPCVLLTGLENIHKHYFYGTGRVGPPAFTEVGEQVIRTGAVLGLLWHFLPLNPERTVGVIVCGMIVCEIFSALTLSILYRRAVGRHPQGPGVAVKALRGRVLRIALPIGFTALLGNLMDAATAVVIPQRLIWAGADVSAAMSAFGVLRGMTMPLLTLPTALISALGLVLLPQMAQAAALGAPALCRERADRALTLTAHVILPAGALLAAVSPVLGSVLFHEPSAGDYAPALALGVALTALETVLAVSLNGLNRQTTTAANSLICGAVQLFLTWWRMGIPGLGLQGYVEALLVSAALGTVLNGMALHRAVGFVPRWFPTLVAPGLGALLAGLCARLLLRVLLRSGLEGLPACGAALAFGGVLYFCALAAQGTTSTNKKSLDKPGQVW